MMVDRLFATVYGFADPIKDAIVELVHHFVDGGKPEVRAMLNDDRKDTFVIPELNVTLRYLLQTAGTLWGRKSVNKDMWVHIARKRAEKTLRSYSVIFDDMRWPNEFDMIRQMGGACIKIIRPEHQGGDSSIGEGLLNQHPFDRTIINDGDLTQFRTRVGELVSDYLLPKANL